ncbi:energy-coupling factor ABC transporter permease [Streptomyces sp. NPDC058953]|uniref:energy-coupling factor ABC transporter permease n=1 Tax=unclassified Streptomyces TaxID=2593676 RepID=UPI003697DA43
MHVPDGFINAPVSAAAGAVAVAAVAVSLRGARRELSASGPGPGSGSVSVSGSGDERAAPLAGLVAAFVFAVQMLNFPVAAGTSGHLLGGALAAILVGPFTGVLCVAVVLLLQSVLFADGGLTALGVNITLIGVVTVAVAYGLFRALLLVLPRRRSAVTVATFAAALVSVPASAAVFAVLYGIGGTTDVPFGTVLAAMTGVHVLIGVGEAVITTATVGAVLAVRPDLVYGARDRVAVPLKVWVDGALVDAPAATPVPDTRPGRSPRAFLLTGLAAAAVLAGVVSFYASTSPDGLERVAGDKGFGDAADDHATADWPLADYEFGDIANDRLAVGLAGVAGVGATAVAGTLVFRAVTRRRRAVAVRTATYSRPRPQSRPRPRRADPPSPTEPAPYQFPHPPISSSDSGGSGGSSSDSSSDSSWGD